MLAFGLMAYRAPGSDQPHDRARHPAVLLVLLFVVAGTADTTLKVFDEHLAVFATRSTYLMLVFGAALVGGIAWMLASPQPVPRRFSVRTLSGGVILGLLNYGSAEFFLRALEELPGTLAYPVNHVAVLLGGTLLGVAGGQRRFQGPDEAVRGGVDRGTAARGPGLDGGSGKGLAV